MHDFYLSAQGMEGGSFPKGRCWGHRERALERDREEEQRAAENKQNPLEGVDAAAHVSRIRTSDFTGLTDNQGLIILGVSQRVIFSQGNYLKNNFCHTGCPCVRRACLCTTLLIWK